jgi:hypothetical protein
MSIIEYMNGPENSKNTSFEKLNEIKNRLKEIESFKTSKGSVYNYRGIGETERFKTISGETYSPSGLTIFVRPDPYLEQEFLLAYQHKDPSKKTDVWVAELEEGGRYRFLWGIDDIINPDNVFLTISNNNEIISSTKAELIPSIGSKPFEISKFIIDDKPIAYRHMGNEITEIIEL